jgi:hypothetical protein
LTIEPVDRHCERARRRSNPCFGSSRRLDGFVAPLMATWGVSNINHPVPVVTKASTRSAKPVKAEFSERASRMRIFNTGRRATSYPDVSGLYWAG